jgi:hypothetical protein
MSKVVPLAAGKSIIAIEPADPVHHVGAAQGVVARRAAQIKPLVKQFVIGQARSLSGFLLGIVARRPLRDISVTRDCCCRRS